ncbi:MAG: ABC transporter substrate-binding protein [Planctomycetes bacterium]|nr:ABC transporter substrate-binding protein [Planctomycetota bacterium]
MYVLPQLRALERLARACSLLALGLAAGACSRVEHAPAPSVARPERIVAASATAVDVAVAVAGLERMAGVPSQALEYSVLHAGRPEPRPIVRFDAYLAESLLALRPDLVVIDPWQAPETSAQLRAAGVSVFALPIVRDFPDARAALVSAGAAFGDPELTARALADFDRRTRALRERRSERGWRGLAYSNFGGAGSTAGRETTIDALFELVGIRNLMAERGTVGHAGITFEDLLALDPDVILVSEPLRMGEGPSGDRGGAAERLLRSEVSLAGLRAVREDRIVALPAWLFATGSQELVSAAEELERRVEQLARRLAQQGSQ